MSRKARYRAAFLVRLRPRQADRWRAAAEAEDVSIAEMVRGAVDAHVRQILATAAAEED